MKLQKPITIINNGRSYVNSIPYNVFSHLVSNKHNKIHRFIYGATVSILGVILARSGGHCKYEILEVIFDWSGYCLHGIGFIPLIDHFTEKIREGIE